MQQIVTLNQVTADPITLFISDDGLKVVLVQNDQTVFIQHDRSNALNGAIQYVVGEINSAPAP
jgi:hypothetical protein